MVKKQKSGSINPLFYNLAYVVGQIKIIDSPNNSIASVYGVNVSHCVRVFVHVI